MKNPFTIKLQAGVLIAGELILLITSALWEDLDRSAQWPIWLYIILFSAGGYALAGNRRWLATYLCASLSALLLASIEGSRICNIISTTCFAVAFFLLFQAVIGHCFSKKDVSQADRILGGIAGYLLLGFFWTSQSNWAVMLNPDAYLNLRTGEPTTESEQIYYCYVTLTGLGYGDIIPTTAIARITAVFNCLSGVLYLAVFISALVGRLSKRHRE